MKEITRKQREKLKAQKAFVLWFTGLSGSGKTTLAIALEHALHKMGKHTYILDGDKFRETLNKDLGFSPSDREENIRRIGSVSLATVDAGLITLVTLISPFRKSRDNVRAMHSPKDFIEVYIDCSLEVCEKRDVKGLYYKARQGIIKEFTGISSPYEPPINPEITIDTAKLDLDSSVKVILKYLKSNKYI
jgi:adenylylsulfate kinase